MTLVPEDGTGLVDANSFCTVDDAYAYHEGHPDVAAWEAVDPALQAARLVKATEEIIQRVNGRWYGCRKRAEQALPFPRTNIYDNEGRCLSSTSVPKQIINATCELARLLANSDVASGELRLVASRTTGPTSVTYADRNGGLSSFGLPRSVARWLTGFIDTQQIALRA